MDPRISPLFGAGARAALLIAIAWITAGFPADGGLPIKRLRVPRTAAPPTLDGRMSDECWRTAADTGDFEKYRTGGLPGYRTRARLCYDAENLYLHFTCADPEMGKVVGRRPQDAMDEDIWQDEEVEIFLDPANARSAYFQLMCTVLGTKADMSSVAGTAWHGDRQEPGRGWRSASHRDDKAWYLEIAVPFTCLRHGGEAAGTPRPGEVWAANFYRHAYRSGEFINWNVATLGFHQPSRFGEIEFAGLPAPGSVPSVAMAPLALDFGANLLSLDMSNPSAARAEVSVSARLRSAGTPAVVVRTVPIDPSGTASVRIPLPIRVGGDADLAVSVSAGKETIFVARATRRLPPLDGILDEVSRAARDAKRTVSASAFPADVRRGMDTERERLLADAASFRRLLERRDTLQPADWKDLVEGVPALETRAAAFRARLAYMEEDNRRSGRGSRAGFMAATHGPLDHVFFDTPGAAGGRPVALTALGGESESFQVSVSALWRPATGVKISASPFEARGGPAPTVGIFTIGYLKSEPDPNGPRGARTWFPDALLPNAPREIPPFHTQPFWVDVAVPRNAPPGPYRTSLTIETDSGRETVPVLLTVRDAVLPETCLLQNDFWISTHGLGWWGYPLTVEGMEKVCEIARRNRISAMASFFVHLYAKLKITRTGPERYSFDFGEINPFLLSAKKHGVTAWNPNLECNQGWAAFFAGEYGPVRIVDAATGAATEFANRYAAPPRTIPVEDVWTKAPVFEQFWKAYVANLKEIGMLDTAWYESVDEPNDVTRMDLLILIHSQLRKWTPELKLMSWGTYPAHHFVRARGYVDAWAPQLGWYEGVRETMRRDRENGVAQKIYTCGSQRKDERGGFTPDGFVRDPNISRRLVPWMCYTWNIDGYLFFAMNPWPQKTQKDSIFEPEKRPWPTVVQFSKTPVFDLLLPGPDGALVESIRLRSFRDGMEDYDCLRMLEDLAGRLEKSGRGGSLASRARKALAVGDDMIAGPSSYTLSPVVLLRRREIVSALVEELTRALR